MSGAPAWRTLVSRYDSVRYVWNTLAHGFEPSAPWVPNPTVQPVANHVFRERDVAKYYIVPPTHLLRFHQITSAVLYPRLHTTDDSEGVDRDAAKSEAVERGARRRHDDVRRSGGMIDDCTVPVPCTACHVCR